MQETSQRCVAVRLYIIKTLVVLIPDDPHLTSRTNRVEIGVKPPKFIFGGSIIEK